MFIEFPKESAWILCALWKRGQKVNGRWPRTGSRRRTRPDAAIRPLTFTATEEKVPKKAGFRRNSTFSLKSLAYRQSIKFSAALCRTTTKQRTVMSSWKKSRLDEFDWWKGLRQVERPLSGHLGHGGRHGGHQHHPPLAQQTWHHLPFPKPTSNSNSEIPMTNSSVWFFGPSFSFWNYQLNCG